jgi:hypothetical protein
MPSAEDLGSSMLLICCGGDLVSRRRPKAVKAHAQERSYSVDASGKRGDAETRPVGLRGMV